jgi:flagellar biosynthesis protein
MASERQIAVALKYLMNQDPAPQVVAKGRGLVAQRILDLARQHGVPVHSDSDLVEVLARLDLGAYIPPELYKAVAEILAYLYRVNKKAMGTEFGR